MMTLFPVDPVPAAPKLSADRRRTLRRQQFLAQGVHPLTRRPLRVEGGTCGECVHCYPTGHNNRTFYKCYLIAETAGAATDLRLSWPACVGFQAASDVD